MKKALLIVDRGSREPEVKDELRDICSIAKAKAGYSFADYCFLEVVPPFIDEGISRCLENGVDSITMVPYFLYPGMKLKDSVKKGAKLGLDKKAKIVISKPLSYHSMMSEVVVDRLNELKKQSKVELDNSECDVLLIGHGSSDKNARDAFIHTVNSLDGYYRNVNYCFLELDKPDIDGGIKQTVEGKPKIILMVPYFLHKGAHVKSDVINDVKAALAKYRFENALMTKHLGVDEKLVDLVLERAFEVEKRVGI